MSMDGRKIYSGPNRLTKLNLILGIESRFSPNKQEARTISPSRLGA